MSLQNNVLPGRRVFLVDDSHWVLRGLEVLIGQSQDLKVCGTADNVEDALEGIAQTNPDIAIVDLRLKGGEGRVLVRRLRELSPKLKILVFSMYDDAFHAAEVLRLGADGYMAKKELAEKVVPALRTVLAGGRYVSQNLSGGRGRSIGSPDLRWCAPWDDTGDDGSFAWR